jgi:hypothetical protein
LANISKLDAKSLANSILETHEKKVVEKEANRVLKILKDQITVSKT